MTHIEALRAAFDPRGLDILDVGAGDGSLLRGFAELGARAVGVEIDAAKVARARTLSGADVNIGTAEALPFPENSFDVLTYVFSFHHIPEALHAQSLAEAARVLRAGGRLVVAEPEIDSDMTRIVAALDDETLVRRAALDTLATMPQRYGFRQTQESAYWLTRTYADFDALVRAVTAVDPARAALFPTVEGDMRKLFTRYAKKTADGFEVKQEVRLLQFEYVGQG